MSSIEANVEIAGKPNEVWAVLTDFSRYGTWNPFIAEVEGIAKLGETIRVRIGFGQAAVPIQAEIVTLRENEELAWRSHLVAQGLFDREHIFKIEPGGKGCTLRQIQTYSGPLGPLAGVLTNEVVRQRLKRMNEALARRVERIYHT